MRGDGRHDGFTPRPLARHRRRSSTSAICSSVRTLLLADELEDAPAGLHRLGGELGRALVADHRVERRDRADAVVDVVGQTSGLAVMPSTQCTRSVRAALMNIVCASKMQAAMTGSNTFSCSCPAFGGHRDRQVAADDAEADHVHDLGDDRVHLARHDRRARLLGRQVDLAQAAARARRQQPQVVADLRELDRQALHARRVEDERLRVLRRLDQIRRRGGSAGR